MEIVIVNQVEDERLNIFEKDYLTIMKKAKEILNLKEEFIISVIFVDDMQIREINKNYRSIDRVTDVISFAINDGEDSVDFNFEENKELGDIFISVPTCLRQASEYGHSIKREACFLFTHGLLHCLGYDHLNEEDEKIMFSLQDEILLDIVTR